MTALLVAIGIVVLVFAAWGVWEYRHAVEGFETRDGYGPVDRQHSGLVMSEEDRSTVRHGGLGR